jgi:hypothetical protein
MIRWSIETEIMIVELILKALTVYLVCGSLFAIAFIIKGVEKVDTSAQDSSLGFRIIIFPGAVVFWPLLLKKWLKAKKSNIHD